MTAHPSRHYILINNTYAAASEVNLHEHVQVWKRADLCMLVIWNGLVGNAPDATPRIVDVVADSPRIADFRCPTSLASPSPHRMSCLTILQRRFRVPIGRCSRQCPYRQSLGRLPSLRSEPRTLLHQSPSQPWWYSRWRSSYRIYLRQYVQHRRGLFLEAHLSESPPQSANVSASISS
jgi:hypothetical protein